MRKNIYNDTSAYYLNTNDNGRQKHGYNNTANINVDYDISDNNSISFGVLFGSNIRKTIAQRIIIS